MIIFLKQSKKFLTKIFYSIRNLVLLFSIQLKFIKQILQVLIFKTNEFFLHVKNWKHETDIALLHFFKISKMRYKQILVSRRNMKLIKKKDFRNIYLINLN